MAHLFVQYTYSKRVHGTKVKIKTEIFMMSKRPTNASLIQCIGASPSNAGIKSLRAMLPDEIVV
jgi:hypothetical protein